MASHETGNEDIAHPTGTVPGIVAKLAHSQLNEGRDMPDQTKQQSVEALRKEEINIWNCPMPRTGTVALPLLSLMVAVNRLRLNGEEPSLWYWLIGIGLSFWLLWMSKRIIATDDTGGYPVLVRRARHDQQAWYVNGTDLRVVFAFILFPLCSSYNFPAHFFIFALWFIWSMAW